jgi:hypothetical protein
MMPIKMPAIGRRFPHLPRAGSAAIDDIEHPTLWLGAMAITRSGPDSRGRVPDCE